MMKNKLTAIFLLITLLVTLCSCNINHDNKNDQSGSKKDEMTSAQKYAQEDEKSNITHENVPKDPNNKQAKFVNSKHILEMGQPVVDKYFELVYTVNNITVSKSISGYDQSLFYDYEKQMADWVNEDGSLKDYTRATFEGFLQKDPLSIEPMGQSFVLVDMTLKNNSDKNPADAFVSWGLNNIRKNNDGNLYTLDSYFNYTDYEQGEIPSTQSDRYAVYFDKPQNIEGSKREKSFFFNTIQPGEELNYKVGYVVDDDSLQDLYVYFGKMQYDYNNPVNPFVKLN